MELLLQYLDTIFIAKPPEAGWPPQFFIITACNPRSCGDRSSDDEARRLRRTLSRSGYLKHKVTGASPDWKHREKGFAVSGLDLQKAIELGREFQQNAIFAIENDVAWLVPCFDGSKQTVGQFSVRLYELVDEP